MTENKNEILVIEENSEDIVMIRDLLAGTNDNEVFDIQSSTEFSESLQLLARNHFDAILLDLGLHDINGIDALRLIHNRAPKTPIIVIAGEKEEYLGISALSDGAQDYLIKGRLDKSDLIKSIRQSIERKLVEESLILKDRAIESSIECIGFVDMCGNIVYANGSLIRNLGYSSADEINGRNLFNIITSKKQSAIILGTLMENGSWTGEEQVARRDGKKIQIQISASLVKNDSGDSICIMVSWIDISDRILAEKELKIRDLAISSSLNAIAVADLDGNLISINEAFLRLTEAKNESELIGKPLSILNSDQKLIREWVHTIRLREKWSGEFSVKKPNSNSFIWVKAMINLVRDNEKNPLCIIGSFMDITDQKKAEDKLFRSEKKYRQLFELANEGIWVIDVNDTTSLINPCMADMLGYETNEIIGKPIYSFVDSSSASTIKEFFDQLKGKIRESREISFITKDGRKIFTNISASMIIDKEGNYAGILAFVTNISMRKKYESELHESISKLNESKSHEQMYFDFLAHDIANIVSPILIYSEMVRDAKNVPAKVKEVCAIIADQARKASSLIINLRKMEELEGMNQDTIGIIDLRIALSNAETEICQKFKTKTFSFSHSIPKDRPIIVKDHDVLENVLEKIFDNAARYTERNAVEIDVKVTYVKEESGMSHWRLEISDHGPGIPDHRKAILATCSEPSQRLARGIYSSIPFCFGVLKHIGGELIISDRVPNKHALGARIVLKLPEGDPLDS